jgi:hypothetical protein
MNERRVVTANNNHACCCKSKLSFSWGRWSTKKVNNYRKCLEIDHQNRYEAAANNGFRYVEVPRPYDVDDIDQLTETVKRFKLKHVLIDSPRGNLGVLSLFLKYKIVSWSENNIVFLDYYFQYQNQFTCGSKCYWHPSPLPIIILWDREDMTEFWKIINI